MAHEGGKNQNYVVPSSDGVLSSVYCNPQEGNGSFMMSRNVASESLGVFLKVWAVGGIMVIFNERLNQIILEYGSHH